MRHSARNANTYEWAKAEKNAAIKTADNLVAKLDMNAVWNLVTTQELPRGITVGYRHDPDAYTCRYCNTDLRVKHGAYSWITNHFKDPWKLQCPECKRRFPSNDFNSFYKTGIDEQGMWSYEKAKENGQQYLVNKLYPEKGEGWGVDDGYGYHTGNYYTSSSFGEMEEVHTYIAYYNHWELWHQGALIPVFYKSVG